MKTFSCILAGLACGFVAATGGAEAAHDGLYGKRTTFIAHHAPRHGGPNEDSFVIQRDDRGVVACYDAVYYPAKYRVDPQGIRVSRSGAHMVSVGGNRYVKRREAAVYLETRTRIKEDYVSLRQVRCD